MNAKTRAFLHAEFGAAEPHILIVQGGWSSEASKLLESPQVDSVLFQGGAYDAVPEALVGTTRRLKTIVIESTFRSLDRLPGVAFDELIVRSQLPRLFDIRALSGLTSLSLEAWTGVAHPERVFDMSSLSRLSIGKGFPEDGFAAIGKLVGLMELGIGGGKAETTLGIESLRQLRQLSLGGMPRLSRLEGVERLAHLKELHIEEVKELRSLEEVTALRELEVIEVDTKASLSSTACLRHLVRATRLWIDTPISKIDWSEAFTSKHLQVVALRSAVPSEAAVDWVEMQARRSGLAPSSVKRFGTRKSPLYVVDFG